MPKDQKKRQKILQRDAARRKQKHKGSAHGSGAISPRSPRAMLRLGAQWQLDECLISRGWDEEGALVQIVVARRSPLDEIAAAFFLVDPGCRGVKDAYARLFDSPMEYAQTFRAAIHAIQPMEKGDLDLAAKIIRDSVAYARNLGFNPPRDYLDAAPFLEGAEPDRSPVPVRVGGSDGKPFFVAGPFDDVPRVLAQLERAVGAGNYTFTAPLDAFAAMASPWDALRDVEDDQ